MNARQPNAGYKALFMGGLVLLFAVGHVLACINMHATDLQGNHVIANEGEDRFSRSLLHHDNRERYLRNEKWALEQATKEPTLENRSDYAACLILVGKYDQAVELLQQLETESPGNYSVAANLGTAYELLGNNAEALQWIETGMQRNPSSHQSSEWLHVEILKTKLRMAEDPQASAVVLDLDFGSGPVPTAPTAESLAQYGIASLENLRDAVHYQLSERVEFVLPREPIVAHLLFQLADTIALTSSVEEAIPVYQRAKEYGCTNSVLEARLQSMDSIRHKNPISGVRSGDGLVAMISVALLMLIAVVLAIVGSLSFWRYRLRQQA